MSLRSFEASFATRRDDVTPATHVPSPDAGSENERSHYSLRATEQGVAIAIREAQHRQAMIDEVIGLARTWNTSESRLGGGWINDVTRAESTLVEGVARLLHLRVAETVIRNAIGSLLRPNRTVDELLEAARRRVLAVTA